MVLLSARPLLERLSTVFLSLEPIPLHVAGVACDPHTALKVLTLKTRVRPWDTDTLTMLAVRMSVRGTALRLARPVVVRYERVCPFRGV